MALLEVDDLRVAFAAETGTVRAVDGVSFTVAPGEVLGVLGASGCGKSVTGLSLLGLVPEPGRVTGGRIVFAGEDLRCAGEARLRAVRGDRIAMIFQDPMTSLNPYLRVGEQLAEVLEAHRRTPRREAWRRAAEALEQVGIASPGERVHAYPHQLSGGMRQRVMIAMALLCDPALIIADEPTTALDVTVQAQILAIFRERRASSGASLLLITHDLGVLAGLADRVVVMDAGRIVEEAPVAALFAAPRHPSTQGLLRATLRLDDPLERAPMSEPLLDVRDLAVHFPVRRGLWGRQTGTVRAVEGVSFTVAEGETLGLVGESGCGKSTTARAVLRLLPVTRGSVRLGGRDFLALEGSALRRARREVQMIFQDPYASLDPRRTVAESVAEPLRIHRLARSAREAAPEVARLLDRVGLEPGHAGRYPHELSGGQRQRVGIARAIALGPRLLFADEPVSALDVSVRAQIVELLATLQREQGIACVFVAHDLAVVRRLSRRVAVMYLGRIVELAPVGDLFDAPLHPYTRALLAAVPVPDPAIERTRKRLVLAGEPPSPEAPPPGCAFHPRCPEAVARCRVEAPALEERAQGRWVACHLAG